MKWKNEIPNKTDFMKINSFNFIENEKFNSELVHERNAGKIIAISNEGEKEVEEIMKNNNNIISSAIQKQNSKTMTETITVVKSETDFDGFAPKRYKTTCFLKPVTLPVWYTESLYLNIDSSKRKYSEKVHFKNKLIPVHWSENMSTEVNTGPQYFLSEIYIPINETDDHYISLIPQQEAAKTTEL